MKEPLASRIRPRLLNEVIGQKHLTGENKILRRCIEEKYLFSMILHGPPGTGKTTIATVIANELQLPYKFFHAVHGTKKDLDTIFQEAKLYPGLILIVDEIHRLHKDKQDLLLSHIEKGTIFLIGATTENPYHSINPAIRSRCHLLEIKSFSQDEIKELLQRACSHEGGFAKKIEIQEEASDYIARLANGDIRFALNILEACVLLSPDNIIHEQIVKDYITTSNLGIHHHGDAYYDVLSAFQKSIRGSDVDAALYYLGILILSKDMEAIERRLLVTAYEDIGLANPAAVSRCVQAIDAAKRVGFPEARIPLSAAVIDLTLSPKSKSAENAIDHVLQHLQQSSYQIPEYLKLTPVHLEQEDKYDYARNDLWDKIQYLPDAVKNIQFYQPTSHSAYEKVLAENLKKLRKYPRTKHLSSLKHNIK
ncbi:MAG: replication-associated recombination protein A [Erysipelotrichaceae bacterium]|nr:replication-associated recombination protein A [Erysipelotrichaceae bacterium]